MLLSAFGREAYYRRSGVGTDSLCSFIRPPGGKFMFLILPLGGKLIIEDLVSEFSLPPPGGKFMFLILPPGGKLIIEDQVFERIAYAPLFGLRAISLCFLFCLRAGSLFYKIMCSAR